MSRTTRICAGAATHTPQYAEVDAHHIRPTYLCALLGVPKRTETVDLCSACHDLIHHAIRHLVNEGTVGSHRFSASLHVPLDAFWAWWQGALA